MSDEKKKRGRPAGAKSEAKEKELPKAELLETLQVCALLSIGKHGLHTLLVSDKTFPRPILLGDNKSRKWRLETLQAWIEKKDKLAQKGE